MPENYMIIEKYTRMIVYRNNPVDLRWELQQSQMERDRKNASEVLARAYELELKPKEIKKEVNRLQKLEDKVKKLRQLRQDAADQKISNEKYQEELKKLET